MPGAAMEMFGSNSRSAFHAWAVGGAHPDLLETSAAG
jgi:hypothetical protein